MPALIGLARAAVIALVQTGIFIAAERIISGLIDRIKQKHKDDYGLNDEDAQSATENIFVDLLVYAGITLALVRTKIPVKVADRLGLTTKGLTKRKLSPAGEAKLKGSSPKSKKPTPISVSDVEDIAPAIAAQRKVSLSSVKTLLNYIFKYAGLATGVGFVAAAFIDFGNWQGAYQGTFQKILSIFGLNPDTPMPRANVVSDDIWKRISATIEQLNPTSVYYPWSGQTKPYSRQALVDLVNEVAAQIIAEGNDATFKNVMAIVLPLIHLKSGASSVAGTAPSSGSGSTPSLSTPAQQTTYTAPKVFTGVVSQGVLGGGLTFEERQDDLIESVEEMKQAAANNLAPFLASLASRVSYELKVVSSIVTKDGFRQTGQTQQIQTGTYKNGTPKYKTVTNRFAVVDLYIKNDKNSRTKLATINLGPTNSAKLLVGANDLRALEVALAGSITTNNIGNVLGIQTGTEFIQLPQTQTGNTEPTPYVEDDVDTGFRFYTFQVNGEEYIDAIPWLGNIPFSYTPITRNEYVAKQNALLANNPARWQPYFADIARRNPTLFTTGKSGIVIRDGVPYVVENVSGSGTAPAGASGGFASPNSGASAATLSEWYQSQGRSLPPIGERAQDYQRLGLGQASYYVGSAEQNTKLLNALKAQP